MGSGPFGGSLMGNLLMHCGGQHVSRDELANASTPAKTKTWVPVFQDRMDPRRYHSNMDVCDRLVPEDLMANTGRIWGGRIWGGGSGVRA